MSGRGFNLSGCGLCRMDDQLLEVVGLYSSLHVGKIQVSLGEPLRMGQAKQVKVSSSLSLSLSVPGLSHCPMNHLSLSHTHTHTHFLSPLTLTILFLSPSLSADCDSRECTSAGGWGAVAAGASYNHSQPLRTSPHAQKNQDKLISTKF